MYYKINLLILLFIINYQLSAQNKNQEKPYSLEKDKRIYEESIRKNINKNPSNEFIEHIINELNSNDEDRQLQVMDLVIRVRDDRIIPILENTILGTYSNQLKKNCIEALRYYKSYSSKFILIEALNDTSNMVKLQAAYTLAIFGEKELSFETLKNLWKFLDWKGKMGINRGLRIIATNEAIELLKKNMNDNNPHVAVTAAIALAKLGYYDDAFPKLKELLNNKDVCIGAMNGLAYIGNKRSLNLIRQMLNDKNFQVRLRSKRILEAYGENVINNK
jgi:HEAT repeat protein